jgi:predicted transcriptional regulator
MSDYEKVVDIIFGMWTSQILYTGVKLGIFDVVDSTPRSAAEIARQLSLDPALSYRLLKALGSLGLLKEDHDRRFSSTPMGEFLHSKVHRP